MATVTMQEDFSLTHHKRLLGIIHDALAFGGNVQLDRASEALRMLRTRMAALKAARNCSDDDANAAACPDTMANDRLIEIVEDGFNHPASHLLIRADQALIMLGSRLDQRCEFVNNGAKIPTSI